MGQSRLFYHQQLFMESLKISHYREELWRHITMVTQFLDDNKTNDEGDSKENGK